jgi:hypothetical protein
LTTHFDDFLSLFERLPMKSKINTLFASLLLGFFLTACGGGGDGGGGDGGGGGGGDTPAPPTQRDEPGNIPGFGETPGTIQGVPFSLPAGVEIVGGIALGDPPGGFDSTESDKGFALKSVLERKGIKDKEFSLLLGNKFILPGFDVSIGGGLMTLGARFRNNNSTPTTVVFPARLVFKPVMPIRSQNLMLLKETSVTIPPGAVHIVSIDVHCGNLYWMEDMEGGVPYEIFVIANSPLLIDLTDRLVDKKINIEEYGSVYAEAVDYYGRITKLQDILHKLTDHGQPLSEEDKRWIEALPRSVQ